MTWHRIASSRWWATLCVVSTLALSASCSSGKTHTTDGGKTMGTGVTGASCTADAECSGANPDCLTMGLYPLKGLAGAPAGLDAVGVDLPGGYCSTVAPCTSDAQCGTGGKCFQPLADVTPSTLDSLANTLTKPVADYFHTYGQCLAPCTTNTDCRAGYVCDVPIGDLLMLVPDARLDKYCIGATPSACGTCDANATCDTSGATATCVCNSGYTGNGSTCAPVGCPAQTIANGTVTPPDQGTLNGTISYGCNSGYMLSGTDTTRTCQADGSWSGTAPTCVAVVGGCTANPCGAHGTCTDGAAGAYTCACASGWMGANCDVPVSCSGLVAPANGSVTPSSTTVGLDATYSCNAGYSIVGSTTQTCQADGTWSGTAPTCAANACPTLAVPANGMLSSTTGTTGVTVTYSCNGGYAINGNSTRTCQTDGAWSGSDPTCALVTTGCSPNPCVHSASCTPVGASGYSCGTCTAGWTGANCDQPVTCSGATAPANGTVSAGTATNGNTVTYTCNSGYNLVGSGTQTCQPDGTFSGSAPTCSPVTCAGASSPANGNVSATSATFGNTITYTCSAGYSIAGGAATRTCQADTNFSGSAPTCAANACTPNLSAPSNGTVSTTTGVTGTVAMYTCNGGYILSGSANTTCQADGSWSNPAPTCSLVMTGCSPNPCVHSASCTPSGATGYSCGTCDPGWSGANCNTPISCTGYAAPTNGSVTPGTTTYSMSVTYACNSGYTLQGAATRSCQADGTLSGSAPTCAPVSCVGAAAPTNGAVSATTATYGNTVTYSCNTGYTLAGNGGLNTRSCQADGTFSGNAPTCAPNACAPNLSAPANGSVSQTMGVTGDTATYSCSAGYSLTGGSTTRSCQTNGAWSGTAPTCALIMTGCSPDPCLHSVTGCVPSGATGYSCGTCTVGWTGMNCDTPVTCSGLTDPANGTVTPKSTTYNLTATYTCSSGYNLNGSATRTCQSDATWSGAAPSCDPVTCSGATAPSNGTVSAASTTYGMAITYGCNAGYMLTGNGGLNTRSCQANGSFSGSAPTCAPSPCSPNLTAPANGAVSQTSGVTGDIATYSCSAGYALVGGSTQTCQANGSWSGSAPTCSLVMTGCSPNPCANGGTCTPSGGSGFTCACTAGWTGTTCTAPVTCTGATAPTNGSVSASTATSGNSVTYTCSAGYTLTGTAARVCQTNGMWATAAPTCAANACPNLTAPTNGTVTPATGSTGSTSMYACNAGYQIDTSGNGGSATRMCQANSTWSGAAPVCNLIQTGCMPNPCLNGGTCAPVGASSFTCTCAAGWTGMTCNTGVSCTGLTAPTNGTVSSATATYPNSVTYACNAGYTLSGTAMRQCTSGGTWAGSAPTCTPNACSPNLTAPTNGTVSRTTGVTGDVATYACNAGYVLTGNGGSSTQSCQTTGTWSGTAPTCAQSQALCMPNPCLNGGTCNQMGSTAVCTCAAGYSGATCATPAMCTGAAAPTNGTVSAATANYPASVTYTCNAGYTLTGTAMRACGSNGMWVTAAPTCAANACSPNLVAPTNGTVSTTTGTTGTVATYTCNAGYAMTGSATTTCQANGTWSSAAPTCAASSCGMYTDIVYAVTAGFAIKGTTLGIGNQAFTGLVNNATTPMWGTNGGTGSASPFNRPPASGGTTFTRGFVRLRYTNNAAGQPIAGTVRLVEWYVPLEFHQTAGATVDADVDHSLGIIQNTLSNCGGGDAACAAHAPTLNRTCAANASGTLAGTTLTWGACTPNPTGANSWSFVNARAVTGAGCGTGWNAFGNTRSTSGLVPASGKGDSYQTWNQQMKSLTFSSTNYLTATFTMPEMQVPNGTGASNTWMQITGSSVIGTDCGSTPGTDLLCNIQ